MIQDKCVTLCRGMHYDYNILYLKIQISRTIKNSKKHYYLELYQELYGVESIQWREYFSTF